MQSDEKNETTPSTKTVEQKEIACDECGRFGAYEIGGQFLCVDCYQGKGSCCQESNDSEC